MKISISGVNRFSVHEWVLAIVLGLVVTVGLLVFSVPGLDPAQWQEASVAAGLVPPRDVFGGGWRYAVNGSVTVFGLVRTLRWLCSSAALVGGLCTILVFMITRQALGFLFRPAGEQFFWYTHVAPAFAAVAALLSATTAPAWRLAQSLTPELLHVFFILLAIHLWLRWLTVGGVERQLLLAAFCGALIADTFLAAPLPFVFYFGYRRFRALVHGGVFSGPHNTSRHRVLLRWFVGLVFVLAFAAVAALNGYVFDLLGGTAAYGLELADLPFRYLTGYGRVTLGLSSMAGWALGLGFGLFPLVLVAALFPFAVTDTKPIKFHLGVILVIAGVLAAIAAGAVPFLRHWTASRGAALVHSDLVLTLFSTCAAVAVALVAAAFTFECQRVYRSPELPAPHPAFRFLVPGIAGVLVLVAVCHTPSADAVAMQRLVRDALNETIRECGDAKWLFTDGRLDAGLRLAAAAARRDVRPLNMMSGANPLERTLRVREFPEEGPTRTRAEQGAAMLLKGWVEEEAPELKDAAIQLGFEFWRASGRDIPVVSGFVAREGLDEADAKRGIAVAEGLAEKVLALSKRAETCGASAGLDNAFSSVSWRISRMARQRGDKERADELDAANNALKRMMAALEYERQRAFLHFTPAEGLRDALRRADFGEARRYASNVLRQDPDDPGANFGMGMACLKDGDMENAERFLRRVLMRYPDEPAVLNNLSIICRKAKRYDEALELAQRAFDLMPNIPEIKQTLEDAQAKAP